MSYSARMQKNHLYSVFLAPRGYVRMADLGMQIAQQYLSPFDKLIGLVGDAGSGKSMLVKGMFPGLELTNDDEGVNVRPLPILDQSADSGFYSPHTYHVDIRFEMAFHQPHVLTAAILEAIDRGKRVVVEHFDLIYPALGRNAHLLIGIGEEVIITRPGLFGPEPKDLFDKVYASLSYRLRAHTAEDLCEFVMKGECPRYEHSDVRHGFILSFESRPTFTPKQLQEKVTRLIDDDLAISFIDEHHIKIGGTPHVCTGPRMHVSRTGEIGRFVILEDFLQEPITGRYLMVGLVGEGGDDRPSDLNGLFL
jgi:hypothetical protein